MECTCSFEDGRQLVDRLREKGYSSNKLKQAYEISCKCQTSFKMQSLEQACPNCGLVYGVTPCRQDKKENIMTAGINY